jgi:hypothetical protein
MGAGVNTIDVDAAVRLHIAVAHMPGANATSVAEGTALPMLAAPDGATREGKGWPSDPTLGETVRDIVSMHLPPCRAEARRDARQHFTSRRGRRGRAHRRAAKGWLAAAGEPIPADHPLLALDNRVVTPHVTWYTVDTMRRYLEHAVDNRRRIRDGRELVNVVNEYAGAQPTG